jgi:hypothetical protein
VGGAGGGTKGEEEEQSQGIECLHEIHRRHSSCAWHRRRVLGATAEQRTHGGS